MKTWRWTGSDAAMSGAFDSEELSTGTSRKPSSGWPSACATSAMIVLDMRAQLRIRGMKTVADRVVAGLRQVDALLRHLATEEAVRNLHQDAGAVAHQRVGADRTAMGEVFQHRQPVFDDPCDFTPFIWAMKPTPQASCSLRGS
jgi:hypothetical protein